MSEWRLLVVANFLRVFSTYAVSNLLQTLLQRTNQESYKRVYLLSIDARSAKRSHNAVVLSKMLATAQHLPTNPHVLFFVLTPFVSPTPNKNATLPTATKVVKTILTHSIGLHSAVLNRPCISNETAMITIKLTSTSSVEACTILHTLGSDDARSTKAKTSPMKPYRGAHCQISGPCWTAMYGATLGSASISRKPEGLRTALKTVRRRTMGSNQVNQMR